MRAIDCTPLAGGCARRNDGLTHHEQNVPLEDKSRLGRARLRMQPDHCEH
jgi:hypothetical protein